MPQSPGAHQSKAPPTQDTWALIPGAWDGRVGFVGVRCWTGKVMVGIVGVQTDSSALKTESQQSPGRLKGSDARQRLSVHRKWSKGHRWRLCIGEGDSSSREHLEETRPRRYLDFRTSDLKIESQSHLVSAMGTLTPRLSKCTDATLAAPEVSSSPSGQPYSPSLADFSSNLKSPQMSSFKHSPKAKLLPPRFSWA